LEAIARSVANLALFGIFPKIPNPAIRAKSGKIAASRVKLRVIFLMKTNRDTLGIERDA
jgi:hypothetical protein